MKPNTPYNDGTVVLLLLRIGGGDETAFREVFDHYKARFHSAAFKMTRSAELAEDIVQEVFIALWDKRKKVAAAKNPEAYLFTILHNSIYAQFRKLALERQLKKKLSEEPEAMEENPVEMLLLEKENRELWENVVSSMPAQQQLVYRLSKQEGLSREEIAQKLNISPNTVRNHLSASIEFIRLYFKKGASAIVWIAIWTSL